MSLELDGLISSELSSHTKRVLSNDNDEILKYYLHKESGWNHLDIYSFNNNKYNISQNFIRTFSIGHNHESINFLRSIFNKLDFYLDIDFTELYNDNGSDIDIYAVNYSSTLAPNAIGQAIPQITRSGSWWEILWKATGTTENLNSNDKHTIIHEIGHSLGLSHPYDDPSNAKWDTNQTVMSYNESINGWDTWYSEKDVQALISLWGRENDHGTINFYGNLEDYQFQKTKEEKLIVKTDIGDESITNYQTLVFEDKILDVENDIKRVFDQIVSVDDITGKIYRLYKSSFNRFPDADGLHYWIDKNVTKENSFIQTASSFIASDEFISKYGIDLTNAQYISTLYLNVLNRIEDNEGFNYWMGQLENGVEDRVNVLMGFSESNENKETFMIECGFQ